MKKIIGILLAALMVVSFFAACGGENGNVTGNSDPSVSDSDTINQETEGSNSGSEEADLGVFQKNATIEQTVLYDESSLKITATGLNYGDSSVSLELLIENNSEKDYTVISGSIGYNCNSINGMMIPDGFINSTVTAANKVNESMDFDYDSLMIYGIKEIADMEIGFMIEDENNKKQYTGPLALKTSAADSYDYDENSYSKTITSFVSKTVLDYSVVDFSDDELFNDGNIRVVSTALVEKDEEKQVLFLEVVNDTTNQLVVSVRSIGVNNLLIQQGLWDGDIVNAGKRAVMDIDLSSVTEGKYPEVFGIEKIGTVTFNISVATIDGKDITKEGTVEIDLPGSDNGPDKTGTEVYSDKDIIITYKGIFEGSKSYDDDLHALFLVENNSSKTITVDDADDSLSINGFMCDYSFWGSTVPSGQCAVMDVSIDSESVDKNSITIDNVSSLKMNLEIRDNNYNRIDSPKIAVETES